MSKIDYSKWDNIDCSSSEEEDQEEESSNTPRVTRLDAPSRITRTADGTLVVEETPAAAPQSAQATTTTTSKSAPRHAHVQIQNWTENGSEVTTKDGLKLYWSQDRYSVCLRLALPSNDITAKDLQVQLKGVLSFADRSLAVGNDKKASIQITCKHPHRVLLEGEFPHSIHCNEDDDPSNFSDWEIDRVTENEKQVSYWVLTVQKATPMQGLVIWWRHPLTQFPEIESRQANPNDSSKAQAFQQAWEEAHRQFKEKTKEKKNLSNN